MKTMLLIVFVLALLGVGAWFVAGSRNAALGQAKGMSNKLTLVSSAFNDGGYIPDRYSPFGANINPPLAWDNVPRGTKSFLLTMEDPDVPVGTGVAVWDHWVVFNIPPSVASIPEDWKIEGVRGGGTHGSLDYVGPRPPDREHRYYFTLYALDQVLPFPEGTAKSVLVGVISRHILGKSVLMGRFALH